ncbi:hypothetical protein T12_14288 [Trichinella patagoniensis]|uniref:Uncharacterized protein n=1 Tax=Trichinella patagoniensis TaxID=990121 RepID=A0A0V0ZNN4_9BILA|nr:hypothetical protein T12_14288 [Trichinella patagoniensis]
MIFTAAIVILISFKACMAQVATCKDDADANIDWFFVYKPPNVLNTQIIKSERNPTWANSRESIDQGAGHSIVLTMAHFVQNNPRINAFAYSDDPPNLPPRNEKSKAKGKAIRYQEPYIYANNLPPAILNQYIELSNLVNGVDVRITPFLEHAKFTTKAAHAVANTQAFGKHSKSFAASIRVWAPSDTRSKSICNRQYQLRKIVSPMQLAGSQVSREADSARWTLVEGKNTICFTTNDYKMSEKQIPGAAICLENAGTMKTGTLIGKLMELLTSELHIVIRRYMQNERFLVYKPPTLLSTKIMKSDRNPTWGNSEANIDQNARHSIRTTMANFIENNGNINVLAYSDDPPNLPPMNEKSKAKDMYAKVLKNKLGASIRIWASSDTRSKSICKGQYQLRKVTSPLQLADSQVRREADSARWAVVDGKNIVCLTTNDYKATEKQIPGAAVCLENAAVYNTFRTAASNLEACNK